MLVNMAFVWQNKGAVARRTIGPFLDNPQIIVVNHVTDCMTDCVTRFNGSLVILVNSI